MARLDDDGTFSVSRTAILDDGPVEALLRVEFEIHARFGQPHSQNLDAKRPVFRWHLDEAADTVPPALRGSSIRAAAQAPTQSGTPVTVTWDGLGDMVATAAAKDEINEIFDGVSRSRPDAGPDSG